MADIARDTFRADELPGRLASQIGITDAAEIFVVEARKLSPAEAAQIVQLRAKVQAGIAQLDAGSGVDGEQVFARLRGRHFAEG